MSIANPPDMKTVSYGLAPGAVDPTAVAPGATLRVTELGVGLHRFQCCIHPWMRAAIRITAEAE